jgi:hypothetical protein
MDLACLWNLTTADLINLFFQFKKKKTKVGQPEEWDLGLVEKPDQYKYWKLKNNLFIYFSFSNVLVYRMLCAWLWKRNNLLTIFLLTTWLAHVFVGKFSIGEEGRECEERSSVGISKGLNLKLDFATPYLLIPMQTLVTVKSLVTCGLLTCGLL